ncbi:tetratricopeptide repeat protein [Oscillatoria amoena NRMC-F 0135]|nr:tetratricopeptide repeat protein [Oscillatoria amoena NRMC-F 0135]
MAQATLSTKSKKAIELYNQADNFRVRGQHQQAIDLLNEAIARDKKFVEAYYRLGLVYMTTKRYPLAVQNFETAAALTTDVKKHRVIWYDLGEAYLNTGQYDKAMKTRSVFCLQKIKTGRRSIGQTNYCAMQSLPNRIRP